MFDIRFGFIFPWHVRLAAFMAAFAAFAIPSLLGATALFLACIFVLVSSEGTEINTANHTYREYTSYMFIKSGKAKSLPAVEKIFITKVRESQTMRANQVQSITIDRAIHNAYLKLSTSEKVHLLRDASKEDIIKKLIPLSKALRVDIVDHS